MKHYELNLLAAPVGNRSAVGQRKRWCGWGIIVLLSCGGSILLYRDLWRCHQVSSWLVLQSGRADHHHGSHPQPLLAAARFAQRLHQHRQQRVVEQRTLYLGWQALQVPDIKLLAMVWQPASLLLTLQAPRRDTLLDVSDRLHRLNDIHVEPLAPCTLTTSEYRYCGQVRIQWSPSARRDAPVTPLTDV